MAKLSPSKVIELALLSALLEGRISSANEKGDRHLHSRRYANVQEFLEGVISVVPAESLFHAMAVSEPYTVLQCCQLLLAKQKLFRRKVYSKFLRDGMEHAVRRIRLLRAGLDINRYDNSSSDEVGQDSASKIVRDTSRYLLLARYSLSVEGSGSVDIASMQKVSDFCHRFEATKKPNPLLKMELYIDSYLKIHTKSPEVTLCGLNLEEVYTAPEDEVSSLSIEHPLTLIEKGRDELNALNKNMSSCSAENANSEMLETLNDLRENVQTCSALLGSFMEAQVHVPLEWQDDSSAKEIATAAESSGLTVWLMLILPVSYMKKFISRAMAGPRKLIVGAYSFTHNLFHGSTSNYLSFGESHFNSSDSCYSGKLEFLMTSMKRSSSSSKSFIAYSLERQLVIECAKRHINYETSLETILEHWDENFPDEALAMVEEDYRPMIARWIKWSLMINQLRESLAEQTAVGVIGLVNSGKSKFVRSMFGIEVCHPLLQETVVIMLGLFIQVMFI